MVTEANGGDGAGTLPLPTARAWARTRSGATTEVDSACGAEAAPAREQAAKRPSGRQRARPSGPGGGRGLGTGVAGASGGAGAEAQGGAAADGEEVAVQLGWRPGVVDRGDLLAVEADGALADQPPGLAPGAHEAGFGLQRHDPDPALVVDRGGGDLQVRARDDVGSARAGGESGVEGGLGAGRGAGAVVELGDPPRLPGPPRRRASPLRRGPDRWTGAGTPAPDGPGSASACRTAPPAGRPG